MKTESEIKEKLRQVKQTQNASRYGRPFGVSESAFCAALEWVLE